MKLYLIWIICMICIIIPILCPNPFSVFDIIDSNEKPSEIDNYRFAQNNTPSNIQNTTPLIPSNTKATDNPTLLRTSLTTMTDSTALRSTIPSIAPINYTPIVSTNTINSMTTATTNPKVQPTSLSSIIPTITNLPTTTIEQTALINPTALVTPLTSNTQIKSITPTVTNLPTTTIDEAALIDPKTQINQMFPSASNNQTKSKITATTVNLNTKLTGITPLTQMIPTAQITTITELSPTSKSLMADDGLKPIASAIPSDTITPIRALTVIGNENPIASIPVGPVDLAPVVPIIQSNNLIQESPTNQANNLQDIVDKIKSEVTNTFLKENLTSESILNMFGSFVNGNNFINNLEVKEIAELNRVENKEMLKVKKDAKFESLTVKKFISRIMSIDNNENVILFNPEATLRMTNHNIAFKIKDIFEVISFLKYIVHICGNKLERCNFNALLKRHNATLFMKIMADFQKKQKQINSKEEFKFKEKNDDQKKNLRKGDNDKVNNKKEIKKNNQKEEVINNVRIPFVEKMNYQNLEDIEKEIANEALISKNEFDDNIDYTKYIQNEDLIKILQDAQ